MESPKKVSFIDMDAPLSPKLNEINLVQDRKDLRGLWKFKQEIWRQDRKDKRAYLELISGVNSEIASLHGVSANTKRSGGLLNDIRFGHHDKEILP